MKENTNKGIGFIGVLQILFIAFKLTGVIDWSWLWVLSPIWLQLVFAIPILIIGMVLGCIKAVKEYK